MLSDCRPFLHGGSSGHKGCPSDISNPWDQLDTALTNCHPDLCVPTSQAFRDRAKCLVSYTNPTKQSGRVVISGYIGQSWSFVRIIRRVVKLEVSKINNSIVGTIWGQTASGKIYFHYKCINWHILNCSTNSNSVT